LNNARLGLIEVVMSLFDAINQVKSNDVDDIDQFVQSLLVFINQEVEPEKFKQLIKLGAIEVNSADASRPADVKLLTSQLSHSDTKVVTMDLYQTALRIAGIPINAGSSSGDTGNAKSIGEGWTMADARANQDEQNFKKYEKRALKLIIDICKENNIDIKAKDGKTLSIKELSPLDIDIKFTRNKSDNLLVKTQGLLNMMSCQIEPQIAFETSGLFSDPNEVYVRSKEYFDGNLWKSSPEEPTTEEGDKPKVLNNLKDTTSVDSIDVHNLPFDKKVREDIDKKEDKE
jgi:SPP1 family phage portal protein